MDKLLKLKDEYKEKTGEDVPSMGRKPKKDKASKPAAKVNGNEAEASGKKQTKLGMAAKKNENLADWYSQVRNSYSQIELTFTLSDYREK